MQRTETSPVPRRWLRTAWHYVGLSLRLILGWFFIGLGVLGVILPILPGMPWLIIGTWLIGRRSRLFRLSGVAGERFLRRRAADQRGAVGAGGRGGVGPPGRRGRRGCHPPRSRFDRAETKRRGVNPPAEPLQPVLALGVAGVP